MKLATTPAAILPALRLARSASGRATLPILEYLLLRIERGRMIATGTDLQTEVTAECDIDTEDRFACCVSARKFPDLLGAAPSNTRIVIEQKNGKMMVQLGRSRYTLATFPADQFPRFDHSAPVAKFGISASSLLRSIERTRHASARTDVRFYLNGIALHLAGGMMRMTASDGHRLMTQQCAIDGDTPDRQPVILPIDAIDGLVALLKSIGDDQVSIELAENSLSASAAPVRFATKLVAAQYPTWERIVPRDEACAMRAKRCELADALKRMRLAADKIFDRYAIALDPMDQELTLSRKSAEEDAHEYVAISDWHGEALRTGVDIGYLQAAVATAETETLSVKLAHNGAVIVTDDDPLWFAMIMPVRL